jgi:hypothetical protein
MTEDKKVRISVEDSKLKDLKRTATELANDMIRSSRQYTTSSKEVLRDLEDQIKLIEKRNRLDKETQISGVRTKFAAGEINKGALQKGVTDIRTASQQDNLQVSLLREVIDTIKQTSKNEIREDRIGVEKRIRSDKTVNQLGVTGDPQLALQRTIQQGLLGDLGEEESGQRGRFKAFGRFGRGTGRAFNTGAQLGTSRNEMYALAGLVGLTPIIGQGMSALANRFLSAGETAETSMTSYATANMGMGYGGARKAWSDIKGGSWAYGLGMNPSEALSRRADIRRSIGFNVGGDDFQQLMGAEKFVGAGSVGQLAGVSRYGQGDIVKVIRVLEGNQRNVTRLTENIGAYVQASNAALNISSSVDEKMMAKTIMGVSRATGQSGIGLNQVTGAIQGLGGTGNPIVKSLMMRSFRQANPNASLFDIQAMMEDPLTNIGRGGGQFFENIKSMTGGGQMYKQVLHSVFGGKLSRTRIGEILQGGGDFTQIAKEAQSAQESGINLKSLAATTTGIGATATARADATFQELGLKTLEATKDVIDTVKSLYERLLTESESEKERNTILRDSLEAQTKQTEMAVEDLRDAKNFRETVGAAIRIGAFAGGMK